MSDAVSVPSDALPQDDRGLSAPPPGSPAGTTAVGRRGSSRSPDGRGQVSPRRLWALVVVLLAVLLALLIASLSHALDSREVSFSAEEQPPVLGGLVLSD